MNRPPAFHVGALIVGWLNDHGYNSHATELNREMKKKGEVFRTNVPRGTLDGMLKEYSELKNAEREKDVFVRNHGRILGPAAEETMLKMRQFLDDYASLRSNRLRSSSATPISAPQTASTPTFGPALSPNLVPMRSPISPGRSRKSSTPKKKRSKWPKTSSPRYAQRSTLLDGDLSISHFRARNEHILKRLLNNPDKIAKLINKNRTLHADNENMEDVGSPIVNEEFLNDFFGDSDLFEIGHESRATELFNARDMPEPSDQTLARCEEEDTIGLVPTGGLVTKRRRPSEDPRDGDLTTNDAKRAKTTGAFHHLFATPTKTKVAVLTPRKVPKNVNQAVANRNDGTSKTSPENRGISENVPASADLLKKMSEDDVDAFLNTLTY